MGLSKRAYWPALLESYDKGKVSREKRIAVLNADMRKREEDTVKLGNNLLVDHFSALDRGQERGPLWDSAKEIAQDFSGVRGPFMPTDKLSAKLADCREFDTHGTPCYEGERRSLGAWEEFSKLGDYRRIVDGMCQVKTQPKHLGRWKQPEPIVVRTENGHTFNGHFRNQNGNPLEYSVTRFKSKAEYKRNKRKYRKVVDGNTVKLGADRAAEIEMRAIMQSQESAVSALTSRSKVWV